MKVNELQVGDMIRWSPTGAILPHAYKVDQVDLLERYAVVHLTPMFKGVLSRRKSKPYLASYFDNSFRKD